MTNKNVEAEKKKLSENDIEVGLKVSSLSCFKDWFEKLDPKTVSKETLNALFTRLKQEHLIVHLNFLNIYGMSHGDSTADWLDGRNAATQPRPDKLQDYIHEVQKLIQFEIERLQTAG